MSEPSTAPAPTPTTPQPDAPVLGFDSTALEVAEAYRANVSGKVFVVTGGYSGIGLEAAKALLKGGAGSVVVTGRSEALIKEALEALRKDGFDEDGTRADGGCAVDLADLESVKAFAAYIIGKYDRVVLVLNAGVMATPPGVTKQGFEQQFGINVLGHFLLAKLLVDVTSRQVWLSSSVHQLASTPARAARARAPYCQ
jgi:NAD(P)-dependent dehydrogenase (short-subunit alcohol dehydrogenase family)